MDGHVSERAQRDALTDRREQALFRYLSSAYTPPADVEPETCAGATTQPEQPAPSTERSAS